MGVFALAVIAPNGIARKMAAIIKKAILSDGVVAYTSQVVGLRMKIFTAATTAVATTNMRLPTRAAIAAIPRAKPEM
jgi:hypothetical protein